MKAELAAIRESIGNQHRTTTPDQYRFINEEMVRPRGCTDCLREGFGDRCTYCFILWRSGHFSYNCRRSQFSSKLGIFPWKRTGVATDWENKPGRNKRECMGPRTERSAGRGLFFCLCSLWSMFLAFFLKVISTASNLSASVGFRRVESVYFCFPISSTRHLRVVMYIYRPIGLQ